MTGENKGRAISLVATAVFVAALLGALLFQRLGVFVVVLFAGNLAMVMFYIVLVVYQRKRSLSVPSRIWCELGVLSILIIVGGVVLILLF